MLHVNDQIASPKKQVCALCHHDWRGLRAGQGGWECRLITPSCGQTAAAANTSSCHVTLLRLLHIYPRLG